MSDAPIDTAPSTRAEANGAPAELPASLRSWRDAMLIAIGIVVFVSCGALLFAIAVTP